MTNVRSLRTRLSWSQTDLARFLGVADSTVARWEATGDKDRREPTGRTADDLSDLDRVTAAATPATLKAIKEAAERGETIRTLTQRALEAIGRRPRGDQ